MNTFPYHKAVAIINLDPDATYVAQVDGEFYSLQGNVMRDFLAANQATGAPEITYFKRFA